MKKIFFKLCKILISGILSITILSAVCLAYSYNMLGIPTPTGASGYSCVPGSLKSKMDEGFGWNVMDANGYNNETAYDKVDVLIMGGSHIEALQMSRSCSVTYKLDQLLPEYYVYNVGTSGHLTEMCANYLENACEYFSPEYVIMDLNSLKLDESTMNSVVAGTYPEPELLSQKSTIARIVRDYIPVFGKLILQLQTWNSPKKQTDQKDDISWQDDTAYMDTLERFFKYIGDVAKEHDTQLILLYHPATYEVDDKGELVFEDETEEFNIFSDICKANDIVLVSSKDENIKMYQEKHVVPNGFSNTRLGSGHLNKYTKR